MLEPPNPPPGTNPTTLGVGQSTVRPSTAELLDAIDACLALEIDPGKTPRAWLDVERLVLWKARETVQQDGPR
jgi:hypothetical protein